MKRNKKMVLIAIILIFIPLTFMKFTTARIRYPQDNTDWLVKPNKLVVLNHKIMKGTNDENEIENMYKGKWYWEKEYKVIATLNNNLSLWLYDILIIFWWGTLVYLIGNFLKGKNYILKRK